MAKAAVVEGAVEVKVRAASGGQTRQHVCQVERKDDAKEAAAVDV